MCTKAALDVITTSIKDEALRIFSNKLITEMSFLKGLSYMPHEGSTDLSKIRLDNAMMLLDSARMLIEAGDYKSAANRSYYSCFAATRSCLALLGIDHKRYSGVISDFRLHYIKTGKLKTEFSEEKL